MRALVVLLLIFIFSSVSGEQGGTNEYADLSETAILSLEFPETVNVTLEDGGTMEMKVLVDSSWNVTSISWVTQICINSGVCHPPTYNYMTQGNDTWTGSIEVENQASYVNWRFDMTYDNESEVDRIPDMGFGWKIWSTCWFDGVDWGGVDFQTIGDECLSSKSDGSTSEGSDSADSLGFLSPIFVLIALSTAALAYRRNG